MKRYITPLLLIPALLMIFTACESMISDVDVPESEPKLVVSGYLSPDDDTISIIVKKSRPLYVPTPFWNSSFPPVNNATVTVSDGMNTVTLLFNSQSGTYQVPAVNMPVIAGKIYSLEVSTPDGYHATSSCTIPTGVAPEVEVTGIDSINQYGNYMVKVSLRFRDLPGPGNFYHIAVGTLNGDQGSFDNYFYETGFERGEPYVSDKNKDGELFTYRTWEIYNNNQLDNNLYVSLSITDENYYNFHRSIQSSSNSDNPFSEPTTVFSNIEGGLGVFAGVNGKITQIRLDE